jgi:hypothetical protein
LAGGEGEEPQKELGWKKNSLLLSKQARIFYDYLLEYKLEMPFCEKVKLSQMFVKQRYIFDRNFFSVIVSLKKDILGKCK